VQKLVGPVGRLSRQAQGQLWVESVVGARCSCGSGVVGPRGTTAGVEVTSDMFQVVLSFSLIMWLCTVRCSACDTVHGVDDWPGWVTGVSRACALHADTECYANCLPVMLSASMQELMHVFMTPQQQILSKKLLCMSPEAEC